MLCASFYLIGCTRESPHLPDKIDKYSKLYQENKDYEALKWLEVTVLHKGMSRKKVDSVFGWGEGPWPDDPNLSRKERLNAALGHTGWSGVNMEFYHRTGIFLGYKDVNGIRQPYRQLTIHYAVDEGADTEEGRVDRWEWASE
jgi:hypothetical protein